MCLDVFSLPLIIINCLGCACAGLTSNKKGITRVWTVIETIQWGFLKLLRLWDLLMFAYWIELVWFYYNWVNYAIIWTGKLVVNQRMYASQIFQIWDMLIMFRLTNDGWDWFYRTLPNANCFTYVVFVIFFRRSCYQDKKWSIY